MKRAQAIAPMGSLQLPYGMLSRGIPTGKMTKEGRDEFEENSQPRVLSATTAGER